MDHAWWDPSAGFNNDLRRLWKTRNMCMTMSNRAAAGRAQSALRYLLCSRNKLCKKAGTLNAPLPVSCIVLPPNSSVMLYQKASAVNKATPLFIQWLASTAVVSSSIMMKLVLCPVVERVPALVSVLYTGQS